MEKITKTVVKDATPGTSRKYIWDTEIKGFGLLVLPSGVKSFVFQYRTPEGRTRRYTIGRFSETLTADQARKQAKELRRAVEEKRDPLGEKKEAKEALTVSEFLEAYLESNKFKEKAETTRYVDRGRIHRHLIPTLGRKFLKKLTTENVRAAYSAIRDGKTACNVKTKTRGRAIVKGGEGAARMAIRVLRAALNWGIDEGLLSVNPAAGVKVGGDGVREVTLDKPEQYKALFQTLERMQNEKRLRPAVADAIRVMALTG
ncbi:MAG: Arm DNA-binding domain-containing protein, partial [Candidatus Thiodiazotropha sp.]